MFACGSNQVFFLEQKRFFRYQGAYLSFGYPGMISLFGYPGIQLRDMPPALNGPKFVVFRSRASSLIRSFAHENSPSTLWNPSYAKDGMRKNKNQPIRF